jgi:hypothetical protein
MTRLSPAPGGDLRLWHEAAVHSWPVLVRYKGKDGPATWAARLRLVPLRRVREAAGRVLANVQSKRRAPIGLAPPCDQG